jgi:predicted GNAT family N-acyltransferase
MTLSSEPFDRRRHIRSGFCCGNDSLDNYIGKQASQDLERKISTVFVLIDEPDQQILAYYTLSSYTVNITDLDEDTAKRLPRYPRLPATLLGRLAVDNKHKSKGYGELMLVDALQKALNVSIQVASLAVIAEALDDKAVSFYIKYGFRQFKLEPMKLYLPIKSIIL